MKLAIVSPFPPSKGTLNEYAYHWVEQLRLKEEVSEIVILTDQLTEGEYPNYDRESKITIEACWKFNSLFNLWTLIKTIRKHKVDGVFLNLQFLTFGDQRIPAALGLMLPFFLRMIGVPVVTLLHNIMETVDLASAGITNNKVLQTVYNFIGTQLTKLVLYSNIVAVTIPKYVDILRKKYKQDNILLIPHGTFELPELPDFNKDEDRLSVMTFGKFGTYKKVERMIEAIDLIRQRTGLAVDIVIAGTDNPNVKGYLADVASKYAHLEDLHFTGYVEEEDVPGLFKDATAVVFPYTSTTGSSGVLHQAGSYGKAVALPQLGDLKELIEEEGYRGTYFEAEDVKSMADAIEALLLDEKKRTEIGRANYAAASGLPLSELAEWYMMHFERLTKNCTVKRQDWPKAISA